MYTDWAVKFRINRPIKRDERSQLGQLVSVGKEPDERLALSVFNSTFIEFVDRRFRLRGALATTFGLIVVFGFFYTFYFFTDKITQSPNNERLSSIFILGFMVLISTYLLYWLVLRQDFFNYTHRPIRFNRKNRMVYVFREGGPKRIIAMPWEQGYFHIGKGLRDKFLLDLRCHIMKGDIVKDTFAVGHYFDREEPILEMWEFIRRYMEEGPEAVKPPYIGLSVEPTLRNCYIWVTASMGLASPLVRGILFPLIAISVLTRYLALRSSRRPKFPAEIEAQCDIEPGDPHALPPPAYISEGSRDEAAFRESTKKYAARKR